MESVLWVSSTLRRCGLQNFGEGAFRVALL